MTHSDLIGKLGQVPRPRLWFALLGAPISWLVQLALSLAFTPLACGEVYWPLYLLDAAALMVSLWALGTALQLQRQPNQGGVTERVSRFVGRFGAWQAAIFVLIILLTSLATFMLPACRLR